MGLTNGSFIDACYGRNKGPIPVWIMRQAGRYLPDYQGVRSRVSFQELCRSPDLIAEVAWQPVNRFGFDAAILFSDIMTMLEPMGMKISFPNGGPQVAEPIRTPDDVKRLGRLNPVEDLPFVLEGIKKIKERLPETPLIGFAGAPFTLACYLIEGQGSKTFNQAKQFLHQFPDAAAELFDKLSEALTVYLRAQIEAGADAVQLFESWGGILSHDDFDHWSASQANKIFSGLATYGVPRILFVNGVAPYLDLVRDIECEVIGVDYRMQLKQAADALPNKAVQGNLDPIALFGPTEQVIVRTRKILDSLSDHDRVIFNLGHGILPATPLASVEAVVKTVHSYRT